MADAAFSLKLIIISGLPGSGKSTISENLAQTLKIPIFSVDPIESAIIKSGIKKSFETGLAAYMVAETLADEQLKLGMSLIIDAVNGVKEARGMWQKLAVKHQTKLIIIECVCSDKEVHKKRIEKRVRNIHGIPEVTWKDVQKRKGEYLLWKEPHLVLDSINDQALNLKRALEYINQ